MLRFARVFLTLAVFATLLALNAAQKDSKYEFNATTWNIASEFLLTLHLQWPIRRMTIVYYLGPKTGEQKNISLNALLFRFEIFCW